MSPTPSIASAILSQLAAIAQRHPAPRVRRLHVPRRPDTAGVAGGHDAEFCAIELEDGGFGLSYVLLGDTLAALLRAHGGGDLPLQGADPLAELRSALSPVSESSKAKPVRLAQGLHTSLADKSSSSPSTYLGALL